MVIFWFVKWSPKYKIRQKQSTDRKRLKTQSLRDFRLTLKENLVHNCFMIIEFLGQAASGKTFIAKKVVELLKISSLPVYAPEFIWNNKSKVHKSIIFIFWYLRHLGFFFNKDIKAALSIIRKQFKGERKWRTFFTSRFLISLYLIGASKKHINNSIVLFSESVTNISALVLRGCLDYKSISVFTNIYMRMLDSPQVLYVYVRPEYNLVLQKKKERFTNMTKEENDYVEKDVESNVKLFDSFTALIAINKRLIHFNNRYDASSSIDIEGLCQNIISIYKNKDRN